MNMNQNSQAQLTNSSEACLRTQELTRWTVGQDVPWNRETLENTISVLSAQTEPASDNFYAAQMARLFTYVANEYPNQIANPDHIRENWAECLRQLPMDLLEKTVTWAIKERDEMRRPNGAQLLNNVKVEHGDRKIGRDHARLALKRLPQADTRPRVSQEQLDEQMADLRANFPSFRKGEKIP